MNEWLSETLATLSAHPPLQGLVAALATFVLEDPTTVGCGLLVADQKMSFATALIGVSLGIAVGDLGLYGLGRLAGPRIAGWGPFSEQRLQRGGAWFRQNVVGAVVLSRFVPGMRLPTYVAAGLLKAPLWRFTAVVVGASLVWTLLLLSLTAAIGERVLPLLGRYRWPVAAAALLLLVVAQRRAARRVERSVAGSGVSSFFEFWPPWLFYIPVFFHWLWLAVRYRGLLLPTAANPSIYSGGFIGESKGQILGLVPEEQRRWVAPWITLSRSSDIPVDQLVDEAGAAMAAAGLLFPVVAKPDVGQRGAGVQPISDAQQLRDYLSVFPEGAVIMLQEMVPAPSGDLGPAEVDRPREAGVLYWRMPGEERGTLFSITLKTFPSLVGDGEKTVQQLIDDDPRARQIRHIYRRRHRELLGKVLELGERLPLVFAGNHCQGAIFKNGTHLATAELEDRVHQIASVIPGFYFGRFDLRFEDLEDLLRGEGFKIIEINGASAEATHIWDASVGLMDAYRTLFAQFRAVFAIGAANRRRGHRPLGLFRLTRDLLAYRRLARTYPETR